jgi:L-lactate utilization protein LutB
MSKKDLESQAAWAEDWLDAVAGNRNTMSQRKLSVIEKHEGGLEAVKALAIRKGVHLLLVEDEEGNQIIAASIKPFQVIC